MLNQMVYVAIPVFNRVALTRKCIHLIAAQTYKHIQVVVADGGSTDGTPRIIEEEFPWVTVLTSRRELWWAGAMAMAIDYVLRVSKNPTDFLLMMNNDTEFDEDYVSTLVRTAQETGAAVGALTVDMRDPTVVLDAGEFIDWANYTFPVKTAVLPGEKFFDGVDVLPGRGTLVPVAMIRRAGNVDHQRFPHYIADYEFFARLKRHGFRLGVTYETTLKSDPTVTGLFVRPGQKTTFLQAIQLRLSRRSMSNILDHYRFIDAAAPDDVRGPLKRRFRRALVIGLLRRLRLLSIARAAERGLTAFVWLVEPPYDVSAKDVLRAGIDAVSATKSGALAPFPTKEGIRYFLPLSKRRALSLGRPFGELYSSAERSARRVPRNLILSWIWHAALRMTFPVYHVMEEQCVELGLDPERLVSDGILQKDAIPGFYLVPFSRWNKQALPHTAKALLAHARSHYYEIRVTRRLRMAEMSIKESQ